MTDFFARQAQAKARTATLLMYFTLAVGLTVLAVYSAVYLTASLVLANHAHKLAFWNGPWLAGTGGVVLLVVGIGCLIKHQELAVGGSSVAVALGGRLVSPRTSDPYERRLLNIVEELSIASGLPVPQVYVLEREEGINAFAAGRTPGDAVVAVTRGALQWLTRAELQGVMAHEFSHILNGDMRLNFRLIGWIAGILGISLIGKVLLFDITFEKETIPLKLLGLLLVAVGAVGAFFGYLIQAAVSRQREYLADASAVQFTRLPDGLAGALKKIGSVASGATIKTTKACEASHLFFGNAKVSWFETHPPLVQRIQALDPTFTGTFPAITKPPLFDVLCPAVHPPPLPRKSAVAAIPPVIPPVIPPMLPVPPVGKVTVQQFFQQAAAPICLELQGAADIREALPPAVLAATRDPFSAMMLVYGMLLGDGDEPVRTKQWLELEQETSPAITQEVRTLFPSIQAVPRKARLAVVDLAIPALRTMSTNQYEGFQRVLTVLIMSDQQVDLFEFALQQVLRRHLDAAFRSAPKRVIHYYAPKALLREGALLVSALAWVGQDGPAQVEAAFQTGVRALPAAWAGLTLLSREECHPGNLEAALDRCRQAVPGLRSQILNACVHTVAADGVLREAEIELLRAIADALECPIPPWLTTHPE
ncbi:MAG: M48 family metallopeptidase [Verrucomicrobiota bacterium]